MANVASSRKMPEAPQQRQPGLPLGAQALRKAIGKLLQQEDAQEQHGGFQDHGVPALAGRQRRFQGEEEGQQGDADEEAGQQHPMRRPLGARPQQPGDEVAGDQQRQDELRQVAQRSRGEIQSWLATSCDREVADSAKTRSANRQAICALSIPTWAAFWPYCSPCVPTAAVVTPAPARGRCAGLAADCGLAFLFFLFGRYPRRGFPLVIGHIEPRAFEDDPYGLHYTMDMAGALRTVL